MPQIWLTYDEAGDLLQCSGFQARAHAFCRGWVRKKSHDGQTRLKLPPAESEAFLDRYFQTRLREMQASSLPVRQLQQMVIEIDFKREKAG